MAGYEHFRKKNLDDNRRILAELGLSNLMSQYCKNDIIMLKRRYFVLTIPTVAGIHGGPEGAYSIALSGGYDDNIDLGEGFTYTGEGGRDLKGTKANPKNLRTAPQSKDQTLTRGNLALSMSVESKQPVRVIRGYKLDSPFAPEEGYRYDGLYSVEKCWFTTGLSGFGVWKFALKRCPNQAPPPWTLNESFSGDESTDNETSEQKVNTNIVEDKENMDSNKMKSTQDEQ
uniref:E3 ubiquitin-protein ligase UHRF1 n=1 Tax=Magallana gigas TaxID=29159 RepID=K1REN5_MAGGI